jgi:hypothetical protein
MNGADVRAYSRKYDGNKYVSKNFKVKEFACLDGSDAIFISPALVEILQQIRDHFDKPETQSRKKEKTYRHQDDS